MAVKDSLPDFSACCEVRIPPPDAKIEDYVSRWSNTRVSLPAVVIVPAEEDDVVSAMKYAAARGLKVIPVGGAHGTSVPIDNRCIYLDMANFSAIDLDEDASAVAFGGGVITRDLIRTLGDKGFSTSVPNSSAVGTSGYCLGGGSSPYYGLKGLAIDHILRIRVVMSDYEWRELSPGSSNQEADLFNVLCGAGCGFGVITSITLLAWRICDLQMDDDRMWTRTLIFPPPAIKAAATLFTQLQDPEPRALVTLIFMRAPPYAPRPGAPMILFSLGFLGPVTDAEKAAAASFDESVTAQAIVANSGTATLSSMNDVSAPLDRHGEYKEQYSAWCLSLSAETIVAVFERWVRFGEETPEAKLTSFLVIAAKDARGMLENDVEDKKFFPRALRGRSVFVQAVPWWNTEVVEERARSWAVETLATVNAPQHDGLSQQSGLVDDNRITGYAANVIKRLKAVWDAKGVFWNPVTDGV